MHLASSQIEIIDFMTGAMPQSMQELGQGRAMCVPAVAGSGKSLTIIELARRCSEKRLLFLAQSRNVVDRAKGTLPSNVSVYTIYEMASRHVRLTHRDKLREARPRPRLDVESILQAIPSASRSEISKALRILERFYSSSGSFPEPRHIPWETATQSGEPDQSGLHALSLARDIWFSQASREPGTLGLTFDATIKLWTLATPETVTLGDQSRRITLTPLGEHNLVVLEESQESTEALINFISRQPCDLLMLGDPFQALRPGNPVTQNLRHPLQQRGETVFMGESWRFGPRIASVLNALTNKAGSGQPNRIAGKGKSRVFTSSQQRQWLRAGLHHVYIANRTASLFQMALEATSAGRAIAWIDSALSYPLILARDLALLAQNHDPMLKAQGPAQVQTPSLKGCQNFAQARQRFERNNDSMALDLCHFVELNNDGQLFSIITTWLREDQLRQEALIRGETPDRDITLSTITRCKGHEFARVAIDDDTLPPELLNGWKTAPSSRMSINRLYTAISRAQYELALPDALLDHLQHHGWPVEVSSSSEFHEAFNDCSDIHPYFGINRHMLLEMSPASRDKRQRIRPEPARHGSGTSGQERIREKIMEDARALSEKDPEALRAELFGRCRRRKID